jgi:hypothetical protein|tara:strand:+ start:825 stop:1013 length:189 start_codon:yes stop_codon:yes gene_type:complete
MTTKLVINGLPVHVLKRKVKIFDDDDSVSDDEAMLLVKYLYDEGFINGPNVNCEIIVDDHFE